MSKVITAEARILASDKTGAVLDKIAGKFKHLEKTAKSVEAIRPLKFSGNMFEELKRLEIGERNLQKVRREMEAFQAQLKQTPIRASHYLRALDDWKSRTVQHWREVRVATDEAAAAQKKFFGVPARIAGRAAVAVGGAIGGAYAVSRATRFAVKAGAEAEREGGRDYLAGLSEEQTQRINEESTRQSTRFPSAGSTQLHSLIRDTSMSSGSVEKGIAMGESLARSLVVLQSLSGTEEAVGRIRQFMSALDVLGKNMDPAQMTRLLDGVVKAASVEGKEFNAGSFLQFARQARSAGAAFSERFLTQVAPALMQDMGDAQLGTSLASGLSQTAGDRATKASKAEQQKLGLRDKTGKFIGQSAFISDPDKYVDEVLIPALKKAGTDIDDEVGVAAVNSKLFSNRTVGDIMTKLVTQRQQRHRKAQQYGEAPGLSAADKIPQKDPFVAMQGVIAQLNNFAAQSGAMNNAASNLDKLGHAIGSFNQRLSDNGNSLMKALGLPTEIPDPGPNPGEPIPIGKYAAPEPAKLHTPIDWSSVPVPPVQGKPTNWKLPGFRGEKPFLPKFPAVTPTMVHGTGVPGGSDAGVHNGMNVSVTGDVQGEAELRVKIEAPELIKAYYDAQRAISLVGQISGNGVGSTGKSSPDAAAPAVIAQPTAP